MNRLRDAHDSRFATAADIRRTVKHSSFPSLAALEVDDLAEALSELGDLLKALKERDDTAVDREWSPEIVEAATAALDNMEKAHAQH